jgi:hypothetical protein
MYIWDATMPFPLTIEFQAAEAFVPLSGQDLPHKPQRV